MQTFLLNTPNKFFLTMDTIIVNYHSLLYTTQKITLHYACNATTHIFPPMCTHLLAQISTVQLTICIATYTSLHIPNSK